MGAYLSQPVIEKETFNGSNKLLEYGGASMQVATAHRSQTYVCCRQWRAARLQAPTSLLCGLSAMYECQLQKAEIKVALARLQPS